MEHGGFRLETKSIPVASSGDGPAVLTTMISTLATVTGALNGILNRNKYQACSILITLT